MVMHRERVAGWEEGILMITPGLSSQLSKEETKEFYRKKKNRSCVAHVLISMELRDSEER